MTQTLSIWRGLALASFLLFAALCPAREGVSKSESPLTVAVAANAVPVVEELARAFTRETSIPVVLSSGSSGVLTRQAREGAPFDLFISADMERVETLAREGIVEPSSVAPYARGVLVLWQENRNLSLRSLDDLSSPTASRLRLALANPMHAPYGAAAKAALERRSLWEKLQGQIVYGEDVGQVLQMARSGNVDAAFLPLSLVINRKGDSLTVPEELYPPIRQGLGVIARSKQLPAAHRFREYLLGEQAKSVFRRHGYLEP